jgi:hypothetical protein
VVIVTIEGDGDPVAPAGVEEFAAERGALIARVNDRREVETATETEVSFADPDDAVRERLAEMGLSEAARGIDGTVRESKVADSNVRETVERRVRERVDEGDLDAFASADDPAAGDPGTTTDAGEADGGSDADANGGATDRAEGSDADDPPAPDPAAGAPDGAGGDADGGGDGDDDQASMEEYL